jgi:hypothetical protein
VQGGDDRIEVGQHTRLAAPERGKAPGHERGL